MSLPTTIRPRSLACLALLGLAVALSASAATLQPLQAPALWREAEFRLVDGPTAHNPFDPDELALDATFAGPGGRRTTVPVFWYQDFSRRLVDGREVLTPRGNAEWHVRFTPTQAGEYEVTVTATRAGVTAPAPVASLRFTVPAGPLPAQHGWVRIGPDHRTFALSDGRALRLSGENVCWPDQGGTFDYDRWFAAMRRSGENFARLWMAPWWAPLEHVPGTLTNYRLDAAWELDQEFRAARADGIYLLLCLDHHGMFQTGNANWGGSNNFWKSNPYNAALGGPCATPDDFFASPRAREIYEKRLRYLIGRYGSSPQLLGWELLNEIDNVYNELKPADVADWHRAVGAWLHAHDPYHHLVTTSLTGGSDRPEIWRLPEMDFTAYHSYGDPAPASYLARLAASFVERYRKPVMIGEFGTSAQDWNLAADPYLRGERQGLWGGALGGSTGTAMTWWWQEVDATDAYSLWTHLDTILRGAGWFAGEWTPVAFTANGEPPAEVGAVQPDGTPFDAELPLCGSWRYEAPNTFAVADAHGATRSAERLNAYLRAEGHEGAKPIRLSAWFGAGARLIAHVNSVAADAELVISVDGRVIARTALPDRDGRAQVNGEYDVDYAYDLPAGRHVVELANHGRDWVYLDNIRLQHVRPASLAGDWRYEPEPIGLRQGDRAIVYVVSPWTVYPAGALDPRPPVVSNGSVTIADWPEGRFRIRWVNPRSGREVGQTEGVRAGAGLKLPLPDFDDDIVGIVTPRAGTR